MSFFFLFEMKTSISSHLSQKGKKIKFVFTKMSAHCFNRESGVCDRERRGMGGDEPHKRHRKQARP